MKNILCAKLNINGIGKIFVSASEYGICGISFKNFGDTILNSNGATRWPNAELSIVSPKFENLQDELLEYASGSRRKFGVKADIRTGTPFQRSVWGAVSKIPWGETRSYKWIANSIGRPTAVRAVANACGANPVPIIIPCHRVIASDGSLGGFSCGIERKKKLLAIEEISHPGMME